MGLFTFRVKRLEVVEREFHIESGCEHCARQLINHVDVTFRKAGGEIPSEHVYGKILEIVDIDYQPSQVDVEVELIAEGDYNSDKVEEVK